MGPIGSVIGPRSQRHGIMTTVQPVTAEGTGIDQAGDVGPSAPDATEPGDVHGDAFDALAADYDVTFTDTDLGRRYRSVVWRRLDEHIVAGQRVLELNCGTGADAVHLAQRGVCVVATDLSPAMVEATTAKAIELGVGHLVQARQLAIEDVGTLVDQGPFSAIVSDFGGMNCVADIGAIGADLAAPLASGGIAFLCVMGPAVPWEWAWYLAHGQPLKAIRRLRRRTRWRGITVRYPSARSVRRALSPWFEPVTTTAIGALVPPPYAQSWAIRHERLVDRLERWERRLETRHLTVAMADHYLLELRRR